MAEEWDLSAIVRSCQSATTTATTEIPLTTTTTTTTNTIMPLLSPQNTSASLATCTSTSAVKEEYDPFSSFPNLLQPITNEFQGLDHLLTPFNPTTNTTTITTTSGVGINSNSPDLERQQLQHLLPLIAPLSDDDPSSIWPHHLVPQASTSGISRFHNDQHQSQQQNQLLQLVHKQDQSQVSQSSTSGIALPDTLLQPQTHTRSRKIRYET